MQIGETCAKLLAELEPIFILSILLLSVHHDKSYYEHLIQQKENLKL